MGNQQTRDSQFDSQQSSQPSETQDKNKRLSLKNSGTTPDLHFQYKPLTATVKHQRDMSQFNNTRSQSKSKQQVLSAMTSRVLLKEKQYAVNLRSFASTCNLHSGGTFKREDFLNNSQQVIRNFQFNSSNEKQNVQPFQNISNIIPRTFGNPNDTTNKYPQYFSSNTPDSMAGNHYTYQQQQYNTNPNTTIGRYHSKSAHIAFPLDQSNQQSPTMATNEDNSNTIDPYKMQQRLLRKLKNQRKKHQNTQQQQPKQKKPRFDENYNLPPRHDQSSSKKQVQQTPVMLYFDCNDSPSMNSQTPWQQFAPQQLRTLKFGEAGQIIPMEIIMTFISFDSLLFAKFLMLTPSWHTSTLQAIDEYCNKFENQFVQSNIEYLFFKQSYTQTMPIKFCRERGLRLDRVLQCELLPNSEIIKGEKTMKVGYQYKVYGDDRSYHKEFKLDVIKSQKKPRITWLHQDSINSETYTQPIQPVCVGDSLEFAMSMISLQGFISELHWETPIIQETPKLSVVNYNKDLARSRFFSSSIKIYCDLNRICELEDAVVEWYEEAYYQRRAELYDLSFLKELFDVKEIWYAGVDGAICKAIVSAKREGMIDKQRMGLEIQVKGQAQEICNEVKRLGYLKDRESPLQLRVGDTLIVYISKSTA